VSKLPAERQSELAGVIEKGLTECLRLDPRHHSAYIDCEMLAVLRFADEPHEKVRHFAELVAPACATGRFWVTPMQRPLHFYPKLRSQPWWEASDFPWVAKLVARFDEIRAEMLKTRASSTSALPSKGGREWDAVGSKHDAGDRELVENGEWTELVLLNRDEKISTSVARNRKLCPITLRLLDSIHEAADMARKGVGESTFSALHAGAHLKPHCGSTNCRLTCHLPLLVPEGCSIRVGDETRTYKEGEPMIFDDSFVRCHPAHPRLMKPPSYCTMATPRDWGMCP
jgi:aspartate beta-hydroxylase